MQKVLDSGVVKMEEQAIRSENFRENDFDSEMLLKIGQQFAITNHGL